MDIRQEDFSIENATGQLKAAVSGRGGTVLDFTHNGWNIFYPYRIVEGKARGGCPICAPWFSRSERGPQHGFLRDSKYLLKFASKESAGFTFVDLQTPGYPWQLIYATMASFSRDHALTMKLKMIRMRDGVAGGAPVLPGFHPYFACSDTNRARIIMGEETYEGFSHQSRMIPVSDRNVLIVMPERTVGMSLGEGFKKNVAQLVLWTDNPRSYICVEPILERKELFDKGKGCHLKEKSRLDLEVTFEVF